MPDFHLSVHDPIDDSIMLATTITASTIEEASWEAEKLAREHASQSGLHDGMTVSWGLDGDDSAASGVVTIPDEG